MNYNDFYKTISKTPFQESISELEKKLIIIFALRDIHK